MRILHAFVAGGLAVAGIALGLSAAEPAAAEEGSGDNVSQEVTQAYEAVRDYSYAKKEELMVWINEKLNALEPEAERLQTKVEEAGESAKEHWASLSEKLDVQTKVAQEKAAELGDSAASTWEQAKQEALAALAELEQTYRSAVSDDKQE